MKIIVKYFRNGSSEEPLLKDFATIYPKNRY
jgi:hypothetical protein